MNPIVPRRLLTALALLLALALPALAQEAPALDIGTLSPAALAGQEEHALLDLYCGPTQGFYRPEGLSLDSGAPLVYFGQYDCWAMVAQGTPEAMGVIGWVEAAALTLPDDPQLGFDDALSAMVEEDTFLTITPFEAGSEPLCPIARGTQVTLLAQYEGFAYVQSELEGTPIRAFLPVSAIR